MAKDLTTLTDKQILLECSRRGQSISYLNAALSAKNTQINNLEHVVMHAAETIADLEATIADLTKICKEQVNIGIPNSCDCFYKWSSIGSNPNTGELLKQCSLCNKIGVR